MVATRIHNHIQRRLVVTAMLMSSLLGLVTTSYTEVASATTAVPTCGYSQLAVAVDSSSGGYAAAGNEGIPFVIVNISKSAWTPLRTRRGQ